MKSDFIDAVLGILKIDKLSGIGIMKGFYRFGDNGARCGIMNDSDFKNMICVSGITKRKSRDHDKRK